MKNLTFKNTFLGLALFTAISFAISYAFAAASGDNKPFPDAVLAKLEKRLNGKLLPMHQEKHWDMTEVVTVDVKTGSTNVVLEESPDEEIHAQLDGYATPDTKFETVQDGNNVSIRVDGGSGIRWNFSGHSDPNVHEGDKNIGVSKQELKLKILMPEKYRGHVKLQTGSGDVSSNNATYQELEIDTGSGDIRIHDLTSDKLMIKTGSGDVALSGTVADLAAHTGSGEVRLKKIKGEKLEITTASGDISLDRADFNSIRTSAASGEVRIKLPGESSRWSAKASSASGEIHTNLPEANKSEKQMSVGKGPSKVDASTSSGDISITL